MNYKNRPTRQEEAAMLTEHEELARDHDSDARADRFETCTCRFCRPDLVSPAEDDPRPPGLRVPLRLLAGL